MVHENSQKHEGGAPQWSSAILGKYEKPTLLDVLRMNFQRFFVLSFIKLTKWSSYQLVDIHCGCGCKIVVSV